MQYAVYWKHYPNLDPNLELHCPSFGQATCGLTVLEQLEHMKDGGGSFNWIIEENFYHNLKLSPSRLCHLESKPDLLSSNYPLSYPLYFLYLDFY